MKGKKIEEFIMSLTNEIGNYPEFRTFEEFNLIQENTKHNIFVDAFSIIKDSNKMDQFIKKHIIHKNPLTYYSEYADEALREEQNPRKALFIIDHILKFQNTGNSLIYYFIFKSDCYYELEEFDKVIYCTDQILKYLYLDSIQKSSTLDLTHLVGCYLEPRINSRIRLSHFEKALHECQNTLNLIETILGNRSNLFFAQIYDMLSKIYESSNDNSNKIKMEQMAEEIREKLYN